MVDLASEIAGNFGRRFLFTVEPSGLRTYSSEIVVDEGNQTLRVYTGDAGVHMNDVAALCNWLCRTGHDARVKGYANSKGVSSSLITYAKTV